LLLITANSSNETQTQMHSGTVLGVTTNQGSHSAYIDTMGSHRPHRINRTVHALNNMTRMSSIKCDIVLLLLLLLLLLSTATTTIVCCSGLKTRLMQ